MEKFTHLPALPGTAQEQAWLRERLETLSVREGIALTAALAREPPGSAGDAVSCLLALEDYEICFPAGSYEQLGEFYLRREAGLPEDALPFADLDRLGRQYEDGHPGLFVGRCYAVYPAAEGPRYDGVHLPEDGGWSVKLKLASPVVPEGVWLRLPDYSAVDSGKPGEIALALDALRVQGLEDCALLDARCSLPEAGELMEQYSSVTDLVRDGNNLGYVLDEQGQGAPGWRARFAAALEFEGCRTLKLALDISQNLCCYEWMPTAQLPEIAARALRDQGIAESLIRSGCIDLEGYAEALLEASGYREAGDGTGFVCRNTHPFIREYSVPIQAKRSPNQGGMELT